MSTVKEFWERRGDHLMSRSAFMSWMSVWVIAGLAVTGLGALIGMQLPIESFWLDILVFGGAFMLSMLGVTITMTNDEPIVSLTGFAMVALPFGFILAPVIEMTSTAVLFRSLGMTTGLVVVFGAIGALHPKSLEGWVGPIVVALSTLIAGYFGIVVAAMFGAPVDAAITFWEVVTVVIFCIILIYDFNRAMHVPRTFDNAIDCALAVYLDFINIFTSLVGLQRD